MGIKFPLATMLDFLQEQLTVILRYSPRQKSFYPNDGILGELFFSYFPLIWTVPCQMYQWQIMQAELLFSNETYKLCIFVNVSNKKSRDWTERLKYIFTRLTSRARSTSQSGRAEFMGHFMKRELVSRA